VPKRNSTARSADAPAKNGGKYQRILDAAIEVIAQHGYASSRVTDIASRARVADGTIYLYFQSKEELLMEAINSAFAGFLTRARADLQQLHDPRERLRRLAFLHLSMLGGDRDLAVVFQTELRHSAKFLAQFSTQHLVDYFELIRHEVREGQRLGLFRPQLSDKIAANCFFGALDEMVTSWILSERDYPLGGAADAVVDVILQGLENRPSAS
jgi:TetR/AcrR family fatty acid metabolism transcriptional regulator